MENVTAAIPTIGAGGCDVKMESDKSAPFLYHVNSNFEDWIEITEFVCANDECYGEIKGAVERGEPYNCTESMQCDCVESFLELAGGLSHGSLLGIESETLERIFVMEDDVDNATAPSNETELKDTSQSNSAMLSAATVTVYVAIALPSIMVLT